MVEWNTCCMCRNAKVDTYMNVLCNSVHSTTGICFHYVPMNLPSIGCDLCEHHNMCVLVHGAHVQRCRFWTPETQKERPEVPLVKTSRWNKISYKKD